MDNTNTSNSASNSASNSNSAAALFNMFPPVIAPGSRAGWFDLPHEIQLMCFDVHLCMCQKCCAADTTNMDRGEFCTDEHAREMRLALWKFSSLSRRTRDFAQPMLYRRVQVGATGKNGVGCLGTLLLLVRTLAVRPDLAAQVETIVLNLRRSYSWEMLLTQEDRVSILAVADRLQVPLEREMLRSTWTDTPPHARANNAGGYLGSAGDESGFRHFATSLLVVLAENVTRLDILNCFDAVHVEFRPLVYWARTSPSNRRRINRLRIQNDPALYPTPAKDLVEASAFFVVAPGITDLVLSPIGSHTTSGNIPLLFQQEMNLAALAAPSFSGLRHLDLFDVNMYRDDFLNAMTWCTNLERLSILLHRPRWTPGPGPYAPWLGYFPPTMDIVTPFDVATILSQSPARATLRTLIIEYPRECEFVMWPGNIGDLRALTRLETLVIGGNALFGSYPDEPEWVVTWGTLDFDRLRMRLPLNLQELHVFNLAYRPGDDGRQELQSAVDVLVANDLLEGIVRPLKVVVHEDDPDATSPRFNAASYPSRGGHGGPGAGSRPGSWAEHFFSYQRVPLFSHHGI